MTRTSKRLWIIEGPQGAGKTTLATAIANATGAHYVKLGPFPHTKYGLARFYIDAMMPAVLGMSDVVMDCSWLSERPYAVAYHYNTDRLGPAMRALERLAWRCQAVVVRCLPSIGRIISNLDKRDDLSKTLEELRIVYTVYSDLRTSLPMVTIDPFKLPTVEWVAELHRHPGASVPHALNVPSAGNVRGCVTLVGEAFPPVAGRDPPYQWPFSGLSRDGCSAWLAEQLDAAEISERDLFWINADALTPAIREHRAPIIALGHDTAVRLGRLGRVPDHCVAHPRDWMQTNEPYPLIDVLKSLIDG